MALLDPVDPRTKGLLWPGCVGFCIVAGAPTRAPLLLLIIAGANEKSRPAPGE
jgi:hypothetical protein